MNKKLSIGFAIVLVLSVLFVAGCSCGTATATATKTVTTTPPAKTITGQPSAVIPPISTSISAPSSVAAGGLNWNDMPVYSGANQTQGGSYSIPAPAGSDYSKFEWHYYQTSGSIADVAAFYKSQMLSSGWTQTGWIDIQGMSYGTYTKNNENDAAMVWISTQDNNTVIAMWRGTK